MLSLLLTHPNVTSKLFHFVILPKYAKEMSQRTCQANNFSFKPTNYQTLFERSIICPCSLAFNRQFSVCQNEAALNNHLVLVSKIRSPFPLYIFLTILRRENNN